MGASSEMNKLVRKVRKAGWAVVLTRNNHWKILSPSGPLFVPSTPSDSRSMKNCRALLKRAGLDVTL